MPWSEIPISGGLDTFATADDGRLTIDGMVAEANNCVRIGGRYIPLAITEVLSTSKILLNIYTHSSSKYGTNNHYAGDSTQIYYLDLANIVDITGAYAERTNYATYWKFIEYGDWLIVIGVYATDPSGASIGLYYPKILKDRTKYTISSITRSGSTATATTSANHGLTTGDYVSIYGATQAEYNLENTTVTVTGATTFTYTVAGTPATPATGSPKMLKCFKQLAGYGNNFANAMSFNNEHLIFGNLTIGGERYPKRVTWSALGNIETFPPNLQTVNILSLSRGTTSDKKVLNSLFTYKATDSNIYQKASAETSLAAGTIPAATSIYATWTDPPFWGAWRFTIDTAGTITCLAAPQNGTSGYATELAAKQAIAALPAIPAGNVTMGYITVQTKDINTAFIPGTDGLAGGTSGNVALTTNYYVDLEDLLSSASSNEADFQDLSDINGPIMQIASMGKSFAVIGKDSISLFTYGGPYIYTVQQNIVRDIPIVPGSFIVVNQVGYFISANSIYAFDGYQATKVVDANTGSTLWAQCQIFESCNSIIWRLGSSYTIAYNYFDKTITQLATTSCGYNAIGGNFVFAPGVLPWPVVLDTTLDKIFTINPGVSPSTATTQLLQTKTIYEPGRRATIRGVKLVGMNCIGTSFSVYVNSTQFIYNSTTDEWNGFVDSDQFYVKIDCNNTGPISIGRIYIDMEPSGTNG